MNKKIRSAKGTMVNFDLLKIKANMKNSPKSINVIEREKYIENKTKRRIKRIATPRPESIKPVEPVKETVVEPVKETVVEPVKETVVEPVKETVVDSTPKMVKRKPRLKTTSKNEI